MPCGAEVGLPASARRALVRDLAGVIEVEVFQNMEPQRYQRYELKPQEGAVRPVADERGAAVEVRRGPVQMDRATDIMSTKCGQDSVAISPDRRYAASCESQSVRVGEFGAAYHDLFLVVGRETKREAAHWRMEEPRKILGFWWSPDSTAVALLTVRHDYLRFAILGHMAIPYDSIRLAVMGIDGHFVEYIVVSDAPYATGRIKGWKTQ